MIELYHELIIAIVRQAVRDVCAHYASTEDDYDAAEFLSEAGMLDRAVLIVSDAARAERQRLETA